MAELGERLRRFRLIWLIELHKSFLTPLEGSYPKAPEKQGLEEATWKHKRVWLCVSTIDCLCMNLGNTHIYMCVCVSPAYVAVGATEELSCI